MIHIYIYLTSLNWKWNIQLKTSMNKEKADLQLMLGTYCQLFFEQGFME